MHQHLHYRGPRRRQKGPEKTFKEIIAVNFPNWERKYSTKSRKHRVPGRINPRRNTLKPIVIKLINIKGRNKILKAAREK